MADLNRVVVDTPHSGSTRPHFAALNDIQSSLCRDL